MWSMDQVEAFLKTLGAEQLGHGQGRTLFDHLVGTRDIVRRWHQCDDLQRAALLHSVYGTDVYKRQLLALSRRAEVKEQAGDRAERLAYLFCVVPRRHLFARVGASVQGREEISFPRAPDGTDLEPVTRQEVDELILLHMANLAEQAMEKDGSPGEWLARVAQLSLTLAGSELVLPAALRGQFWRFSSEDESLVRNGYRSGLLELDDPNADAEHRLAQLIVACPMLPEPYIWFAYISLRRQEWGASDWWASRARERLNALGTVWDKRLTFEQWLAVVELIEARSEARSVLPITTNRNPPRLLATLSDTGQPVTDPKRPSVNTLAIPTGADHGRERFYRYMETFAQQNGDKRRRRYPGLPSQPYYNPDEFPLTNYLETNFPAIREEILALDPLQFHQESEKIERTGNWDVLFFYDRGRRVDANCDACPVTVRGIDNYSAMRSIAGLIYVSRLRGGTHIAAHRGPTNFRLRCHLGIVVPEGDCAIRNGGVTRSWHEGRCLVLDDYFEHEAWNHTKQDRLVLVIDIWHPELTPIEIQLLNGLHTYAYRYAQQQHQWWNKHYAGADVP
jgi:aspartate beta-hydroxylase